MNEREICCLANTFKVMEPMTEIVAIDGTSEASAGFKNVDAQPVGSGASLREMIRNIDNYLAIG